MTDINDHIEAIRNMKQELISIKMSSQRTTENMLQDLAGFRNKMTQQISRFKHNRIDDKKKAKNHVMNNNPNDYLKCRLSNSSQEQLPNLNDDLGSLKDIVQKIKQERKRSEEMLFQLDLHHNSLSNLRKIEKNDLSISNETNLSSNKNAANKVTMSPSSQNFDDEFSSSNKTYDVKFNPLVNQDYNFRNENLTMERIGTLSQKLQDIQQQNDELQIVNENIQHLLTQLNALRNLDIEPVEVAAIADVPQKTENKLFFEAQVRSDNSNGNYKEYYKAIVHCAKMNSQEEMMKKIKEAKVIINRIRSCDKTECNYEVRFKQTQENIELQAHINESPQ